MKKWETLKSELVFDTKWYKVRKDEVRLPDGRVFDDYYVGVLPDYINLIPLFDNGDILLAKQYKHAAGTISLETIGGIIDKEGDPLSAARRELLEETGYEASQIEELSVVYENPTKVTSKTHIFMATGLKQVREPIVDTYDSNIELVRLPFTEFFNKIQSGEVCCEPAIVSAFLVYMKLGLHQPMSVQSKSRFSRLPLLSRLFK